MIRQLKLRIFLGTAIFLAVCLFIGYWFYQVNHGQTKLDNVNNLELLSEDINQEIEGEEGEKKELINNEIDNQTEQEKKIVDQEIKSQEREKIDSVKQTILFSVPFTSQAPLFNWQDPRQQDGCEEAVVIMALAWAHKEEKKSPAEYEEQIITLADFQAEKYGEFRDTTLSDIKDWLFIDYYDYSLVELKALEDVTDIISELEAGKIVLLPLAGQEIKNPHFTPPGPLTHMILVKGYDYITGEFITNDSGTRLGNNYRYSADLLFSAIWVYPTGFHQVTTEREKAMLTVSQSNVF